MNSFEISLAFTPPKPEVPIFDGSWSLQILVTDLQVERTIRIRSDMHIGALMIKLVDELDIAMDWSDHAMWWPEKNIWLDKTRWTLDQYNVTADAFLHFTPMHKSLRLQLPDLRYIDCTVDFSIKTFSTVINLCNELEIRHPEELSLCKPIEVEHLKYNYGEAKQAEEKKRRVTLATMQNHNNRRQTFIDYNDRIIVDRPDTNTFVANNSASATMGRKTSTLSWAGSPNTLFRSTGRNGSMTLGRRTPTNMSMNGTWRSNGKGNYSFYSNGKDPISPGFPGHYGSEWSLAMSPPPSEEARYSLLRPKNMVQRARMNVAWLDSSLSLMEQGIRDFDTLLMRFKFYTFYDLNPKTDPVRINLIYEQAKWQILNGVIDCTEEEMMLFAALQLQVGLQANVPQPSDEDDDDDLDAALTDLQLSLEGGNLNSSTSILNENLTTIPTLCDHLSYLRPKRFTIKGYKQGYCILRELQMIIYRHKSDLTRGNMPTLTVSLKGCEVTPSVNISHQKYGFKLAIPSSDGMSDLWVKCVSETQYAHWLAGCRLAAKGKTMANSGYETEVKAILAFLSMQHPAKQPVINPLTLDIQIEDYLAQRFMRKPKSKLRQKILESHANVKDLNLMEAKMNFIKAWQSLPDYGVSLFVVKFHGEKKEELLGIAFNRLMRMSLQFGDHLKTWRFNTIKAWNVNWETKHMMIQLGDGKSVIFKCLSADCKVVHEFIGGYIFLSMRSKDMSQTLDEELFHKLTGGWQ